MPPDESRAKYCSIFLSPAGSPVRLTGGRGWEFQSLRDEGLRLEREDPLPVVLHADDDPALLRGLVVERLREGADLAVRQSLGRAVGVLALRVVVQHEHRQARAIAGPGVLQHLPIAGRVAE